MFKIRNKDFPTNTTFKNKYSRQIKDVKHEKGCLISFISIVSLVVILNVLIIKDFASLFFLLVPIATLALYKRTKDKSVISQKYEIEENQKRSFIELLNAKKLLAIPALLNSNESVSALIETENLDIETAFATKDLQENIETMERELISSLTGECGSVELKERLLEEYDIDLSVIDRAITCIEEVLPVGVDDITYDINCRSYATKKAMKQDIECGRINLNLYYAVQNEEINQLLKYGCNNVSTIDFEKEKLRINNLKYYPSHTICLPFDMDEFEQKYRDADKTAVLFYNERILKNSIYPSFIEKDFELSFKENTLVVDYKLPNIEDINLIKKINKQLDEIGFSEKELNIIYEHILYQITLRTIYELLCNDKINAVESIVFNGWLNYTDLADGNRKTSCILSMHAKKDEFMTVNLQNVDPKACFKKFKGISCNNLSTITPVRPILFINKEDKRFIESYEVLKQLSDGQNIAMLDWRDFENLVKEIFEQEFAVNGGEVKVTQSSRDGGVDAIAFNPDPLMGGKIVIQAKRYINVVPVSAVRDLYGTILNEGANKGILVTTSHFGSDSFEFAKDKPITLIEGSNLLHLMEKHGRKARIDVNEAKLLKDN